MSGREDTETGRRDYRGPYTPHHPIPTIQKYREQKQERQEQYGEQHQGVDKSRPSDGPQKPYESENKNIGQEADQGEDNEESQDEGTTGDQGEAWTGNDDEQKDDDVAEDTSEAVTGAQNPKQKRKHMKNRKEDPTERQVTDPVTHMPVTIHDFTAEDLKRAPHNKRPRGQEPRTATGFEAAQKGNRELKEEQAEAQESHDTMEALFPPPDFDITREQITSIYRDATTKGFGVIAGVLSFIVLLERFIGHVLSLGRLASAMIFLGIGAPVATGIIWGMRQWMENKIKNVWENEVWEAERRHGKKKAMSQTAESTQWLNSLLASIWPLVNPDLFTSLADTLEDVMQASLPRMVRMVSVDDLGQGSESIRILGIRWLPTGAAAKSVSADGKQQSGDDQKHHSDRTVPGEGDMKENPNEGNSKDSGNDDKNKSQEGENIAEGMEGEEGDFVNVEIAFAYRARAGGKGIKNRSKNAHLYVNFYLPSGIKFPVWVELHGIVGVVRLRLQLTPDPPFFSLCTLTFLGQPKVDLSCIPLIKRGPNIMDMPLISNFVQSSVDAATAEYVAPRSLTLDLKDMLMGDDFKKDTSARGVLVVRIKRAFGFKEGDTGVGFVRKGSSDPYVSVGWAKFGKPIWSTRIITSEMEPCWDETAFVLVTPEELNVEERLRLQLWDSDRTTADDDLGRIEVDLKQLMRDPQSNGKMSDRQDGFKSTKPNRGMPGKLEWSVGYFSKTRITDDQLAQQSEDPDIHNIDQLKEKVYKESENKLREAKHDESAEIQQQKAQDLKERQDQLLIHSPPPHHYPTGVLSIQIHQITGLELEQINKNRATKKESESDEKEDGDDLPSSYCSVILNHEKIFRTRTKPKNSKPFFNAGCERVIRDWHTAEIHIAVRDSRVHENDPLLGIIYLPLGKVFAQRSQINDFFPLSGGVGYGRARISMVFRSIKFDAPRELLGWEYGTVEIQPEIRSVGQVSHDIQGLRLKARTLLARGKLFSSSSRDKDSVWRTKADKPLRLPVRKRYCSPLILEFRSSSALLDKTPAFAILWLKDIPDDEEKTIELPVWRHKDDNLKRASTCVLSECGEQLGTIKLTLTFWSGLNGFHSKLASKDRNIADVMEVLDTARDNHDIDFDEGGEASDGEETSDSSSESSDEDRDSELTPTTTHSNASEGDNLSDNGKRGPIDTIKDYKNNRKELHRRNRGIMQWKGPRTVQWMKKKLEHGEQHVESFFKHSERDTGIETEV